MNLHTMYQLGMITPSVESDDNDDFVISTPTTTITTTTPLADNDRKNNVSSSDTMPFHTSSTAAAASVRNSVNTRNHNDNDNCHSQHRRGNNSNNNKPNNTGSFRRKKQPQEQRQQEDQAKKSTKVAEEEEDADLKEEEERKRRKKPPLLQSPFEELVIDRNWKDEVSFITMPKGIRDEERDVTGKRIQRNELPPQQPPQPRNNDHNTNTNTNRIKIAGRGATTASVSTSVTTEAMGNIKVRHIPAESPSRGSVDLEVLMDDEDDSLAAVVTAAPCRPTYFTGYPSQSSLLDDEDQDDDLSNPVGVHPQDRRLQEQPSLLGNGPSTSSPLSAVPPQRVASMDHSIDPTHNEHQGDNIVSQTFAPPLTDNQPSSSKDETLNYNQVLMAEKDTISVATPTKLPPKRNEGETIIHISSEQQHQQTTPLSIANTENNHDGEGPKNQVVSVIESETSTITAKVDLIPVATPVLTPKKKKKKKKKTIGTETSTKKTKKKKKKATTVNATTTLSPNGDEPTSTTPKKPRKSKHTKKAKPSDTEEPSPISSSTGIKHRTKSRKKDGKPPSVSASTAETADVTTTSSSISNTRILLNTIWTWKRSTNTSKDHPNPKRNSVSSSKDKKKSSSSSSPDRIVEESLSVDDAIVKAMAESSNQKRSPSSPRRFFRFGGHGRQRSPLKYKNNVSNGEDSCTWVAAALVVGKDAVAVGKQENNVKTSATAIENDTSRNTNHVPIKQSDDENNDDDRIPSANQSKKWYDYASSPMKKTTTTLVSSFRRKRRHRQPKKQQEEMHNANANQIPQSASSPPPPRIQQDTHVDDGFLAIIGKDIGPSKESASPSFSLLQDDRPNNNQE